MATSKLRLAIHSWLVSAGYRPRPESEPIVRVATEERRAA